MGVSLIALRRYSAQARYLVAVGLLGGFFLTAAFTFVKLYTLPPSVAEVPTQELSEEPESEIWPEDGEAWTETVEPAPQKEAEMTPVTISLRERTVDYFNTHLPLIVTLWLMGVMVLLLRLLGQLAYVQRLKSYGATLFPPLWHERIRELEARLGLYRPVRYALSYRITSPMIFGWLRPVLLFPKPLFEKLTDTQIYAILAHEMAHIRRNDFLVNLLQQLLATLFFYHPGVWWMSARIEEEREHSCDDLAVHITREPIGYAKTLIKLTEEEMNHPTVSMAIQGREATGFRGRITRLLSHRFHSATFGEGVVTTLLLVLSLGVAILATGQAPDQSITTSEVLKRGELTTVAESENNGSAQMTILVPTDESERFASDDTAENAAPAATDDLDLFLEAIDDGNRRLVDYFLEKGVDVNGVSDQGITPLIAAAKENQAEIARLLIDRGAKVNFVNEKGWTALMEAADEGAYETAQVLMQAGAQIELHGEQFHATPLGIAASEGHLDILKMLLDAGANANGPAGSQPPLHEAAEEGHLEVVRYLLDAGTAVDQRDQVGRTALFHAAKENQVDVIWLLLDRGADPGLTDNNGHSALDEAAEEDAVESIEKLLATKQGSAYIKSNPRALIRASREGALETVRRLLAAGMDVNATGEDGETALMMAAREDEYSVAQFLIDKGAKVNVAMPNNGWTPLLLASREGAHQVIRLLLDKGADLTARTSFQEINIYGDNRPGRISYYYDAQALFIAVQEDEPESLKVLLAAGADVNTGIRKSRWVLPEGSDWKSASQIDPGQGGGLKLMYQTENWTALMEAVEEESVTMVELLLKAGADVAAKAGNGTTALSLAKELKNTAIIRLLERR